MKLYILEFPNGKHYVGISSDPARRLRDHIKLANKGSMFPVHCAIRKYRNCEQPIVQTIVAEGDSEYIQFSEMSLIALLQTTDREYGYNVTYGGELSPMRSESVRAKVIATRKAMGATPAMLANAQRMRGRKASDEHRRKLREAHLGKPWTEKQRIAADRPEARARRSAAQKEVSSRPEIRARRSLSQKGKKLSPEHLANVVMANRKVGRTPAKIEQLRAVHEGLRGKKRPYMATYISALRWITNGSNRRRVPSYFVLEQGWYFGKA